MKITELQNLRCRAGLSQAELAQNAGISRDTISRIESDRRTRAHAITANKLALALGAKVDELAGSGNTGDHGAGELGINTNQDAVAKRIELFEISKELADNRLDLVLDLARELAFGELTAGQFAAEQLTESSPKKEIGS